MDASNRIPMDAKSREMSRRQKENKMMLKTDPQAFERIDRELKEGSARRAALKANLAERFERVAA
jgi:hypothetical protein